jgi:uncharacterized protein (TIGR00255 family)
VKPVYSVRPVYSMTGFATLEAALPDGRALSLSLKSVNHRHLDLLLKLGYGLDTLEPALRKTVKTRVRRGHVELSLSVERASAAAGLVVDHPLLAGYVSAFREAANVLDIAQQPDLNALLRMPGVLSASTPAGEDAATLEAPVLAQLMRLHDAFDMTRSVEGDALAAELRSGMERVQTLALEAKELRTGVAAAEFARLKTRMAELLANTDVSPERLLQEAALLAGRSDIEEELVRLLTHVTRFTELLDAGGEVGRQLDFLLQEMNREANTALSKSGSSAAQSGLRLTEIGLAVKAELERAREQVQNLE